MTILTVVTFEPDWVAAYVDGELYDEGHHYQESQILQDVILDDGVDIDEINTDWFDPETWMGTPETVEKCEEMYGDTE